MGFIGWLFPFAALAFAAFGLVFTGAAVEKRNCIEEFRDLEKTYQTAFEESIVRQQELYAVIQALDIEKSKEVRNAKLEADALRTCLRDGSCGVLYVPTSEDNGDVPSPGSLGDGDPEIPRHVQQDLLDLREAVTIDTKALEYLQDYAKACHESPNL